MKLPKTADGTQVRGGLSMQRNAGGFPTPGGMGPSLQGNTSDATLLQAKERGEVQAWLEELQRSGKRLEAWLKTAKRIVAIYEAEKAEDYQYNILYANTETLAPALYNSVPRPVVQRRFRDTDTLGKAVSAVTQRTLEYLLDDNLSAAASFDDLMKSSVLEALVPGWGVVWVSYEADFESVYGESDSAEHEATEPPEWEKVENERIIGEHIPYDRFRHGYGKKWCEVPWVARLHVMTKAEIISNFGEQFADVPVSKPEARDDRESAMGAREQSPADPVGNVWEIWDKSSRKVYFVMEGCERYLKALDDPLNLSGFFPCPRPLTFVQKIKELTPVPLYSLYEEQAKELNAVTVRINKIVRALKVRGMYDATVEGLDKVLSSDDNTLVPAQNVAALVSQGMTLEKSIWLMPIEKLIAVLQQLYQQREQVKQVIYELTGIADIMRGSSAASETLGAQQIKETWGTLRMKRLQKEVGRFARDCLRMMVELSKHFSPETLKAMTGLQFPAAAEKMQAQAQMQQAMMQAQMTGQQPPPPPPELMGMMQSPTWEDIHAVINDDILRSFKVDIETNSTVDAEATEDKQQIAEVMNAISQFLNGVAPLVEQGSMPFDVAKEILLTIVRRFRFGPEVEDKLTKMAAPQPKPDPNVQKVQAQLELDKQQAELDMRGKQMELQMRERELQMEMEFKQQEHQLKLLELQQRQEAAALSHRQKMQTMAVQAMLPKPAAQTGAKPRGNNQ